MQYIFLLTNHILWYILQKETRMKYNKISMYLPMMVGLFYYFCLSMFSTLFSFDRNYERYRTLHSSSNSNSQYRQVEFYASSKYCYIILFEIQSIFWRVKKISANGDTVGFTEDSQDKVSEKDRLWSQAHLGFSLSTAKTILFKCSNLYFKIYLFLH